MSQYSQMLTKGAEESDKGQNKAKADILFDFSIEKLCLFIEFFECISLPYLLFMPTNPLVLSCNTLQTPLRHHIAAICHNNYGRTVQLIPVNLGGSVSVQSIHGYRQSEKGENFGPDKISCSSVDVLSV